MIRVPDKIRFGDLARAAARALNTAGLEHRIDIYRDIEVEDPVTLRMLGRPHLLRLRIKITAESLLYGAQAEAVANNVVRLPEQLEAARKADSGSRRAAQSASGVDAMKRRTGS